MKQHEDEDEEVAYTFCQKCGEMFESSMLLACSFCSRHFCQSCNHRVAGKNYCSRNCWELMFFGDAESEDEAEPEDAG